MRRIILFMFLSFVAYYIFFSCANIKPPQGGPRDTLPPVLIQSMPENKSLNFQGNTVRLTFDEMLKIDNLNSKLIITPYFDSEFEIDARKNYLELTFENPFSDSTTYTFNFQDAIKDITENNPTLDNVLAFSTGAYIDSIRIFGKVFHLMNNSPADNIIIGLYQAYDTTDLFSGKPMYFTKTDKKGIFFIENIKNDKYRIAAFTDKNSNLRCDVKDESYGFIRDTIDLMTQKNDSVYVNISFLDLSDISVLRSAPSGKYYEVRTNKYIVDYSLHYDSSYSVFSNLLPDHRIIRFYKTFEKDSLEVFIDLYDSVGNALKDTLYVKFIESKRSKEKFSFQVKPENNKKIFPEYHGEFSFNKPILTFNTDSIYFLYDSADYSCVNTDSGFIWNKYKTELHVLHTLDPSRLYSSKSDSLKNKVLSEDNPENIRSKSMDAVTKGKLTFYLGNGTFVSADNDSSKMQKISYSFYQDSELSTLKGKIETGYTSFIIQLLNNRLEVVSELNNQHEYEFVNINPGTYLVRILIDNNGNGKWDPGNYIQKIEPEDVYLYPEEIILRANWEIVDINFSI